MNIFILVLLGIIINNSCFGQLSSNFSHLSTPLASDTSYSKTKLPDENTLVLASDALHSPKMFNAGINIRCACEPSVQPKVEHKVSDSKTVECEASDAKGKGVDTPSNFPVGSSKRFGGYWNKRLLPLWCYKKIVGIVGYPPAQIPFLKVKH